MLSITYYRQNTVSKNEEGNKTGPNHANPHRDADQLQITCSSESGDVICLGFKGVVRDRDERPRDTTQNLA